MYFYASHEELQEVLQTTGWFNLNKVLGKVLLILNHMNGRYPLIFDLQKQQHLHMIQPKTT